MKSSPFEDPYKHKRRTVTRLVAEYKKHGSLIIGVDFDDTIYDCHDQGFTFPETIRLLQEAQDLGCKLCVWTANQDELLVFTTWANLGLRINYYNESPVVLHKYQVKPYFNLLLDDRAGLHSAIKTLRLALKQIKELK